VNVESEECGRDTRIGREIAGDTSGGEVGRSRREAAFRLLVQGMIPAMVKVCRAPIVTTNMRRARIGVLTRRDLGSDSADMVAE